MNCKSYDSFFTNFANKTKLDIILSLQKKPLTVTQISDALKQEQSKISHNLAKLSSCRILHVQKKGRERIYSLNKETVLPILELVKKHVKNNCCERCCTNDK